MSKNQTSKNNTATAKVITSANQPQQLQVAKIKIINRDHGMPYLATPLFALKFIETEQCLSNGQPTFAVDKYYRLYYHPEVFNRKHFTDNQLKGALIHELNHLLRQHHKRGEHIAHEYQQTLNLAQDLAINTHFEAMKLELPKWAAFPAKFSFPESLMSEEYFDLLLKNHEKLEYLTVACDSISSGNCGSCADGQPRPWELPIDDKDYPAINSLEQSLIQKKTAEEIISHQKNRGNIPGDLLRWAEEIVSPQINWKNELKAKITNAVNYERGLSDYTYSIPSRRQGAAGKGLILPGQQKPLINITVIIDTSGSMDSGSLSQCLAETKSILQQSGLSRGIRFITCDAQIHGDKQITNLLQAKNLMKGGGGTDMTIAIESACNPKNAAKPNIIILLTDGYTPWPRSKPKGVDKFIAAVIDGTKQGIPEWWKVVEVNIKRNEKNN